MRVVKWVFGLLVLAVVGLFLHYVLPKHEVVYVTSTENRIVSPDEVRGFRSFGEATANAQGQVVTDVFFINTTKRNGAPLVFRNEDTGFGFPPYFKFDSANLQAEAQDAVSTRDTPRWVVVRYYGWRIPFLSTFPNATSMEPAASADVRVIPWFNIVLLILLLAVVWAIWSRLRRWQRRRADPVVAAWQPERARRGWFR
ncbi:DUF1523 family protein [Rubellimicrobium aerolatum]|uniref:DUF1523 family protein n=1 Tax=Rubellimicrobium aerolatum TaxID=490979 RepID=A0ABW0SAL7_9RHOB|nr:DUF1523 family protein [Rubellimicrobium aerolatum]MBP1806098.1 hypothetical protein [Rubellimicrobium aerolatum]